MNEQYHLKHLHHVCTVNDANTVVEDWFFDTPVAVSQVVFALLAAFKNNIREYYDIFCFLNMLVFNNASQAEIRDIKRRITTCYKAGL